MLISEAEKLVLEKHLEVGFKELRDIDGPGFPNTGIIEKEERPEDGGVLIYSYGYKYPYKGIPWQDTVERFRIVKKMFYFAIHFFNNKITMGAIGLALLLKPVRKSIIGYLYMLIYWLMYYQWIKPERYCYSVRELYRAFTEIMDKQKDETNLKIWALAREIFCTFIEQDSAYKFRFQDIMAEVNVSDMRKGGKAMVKEIQRLFQIIKKRELVKEFRRLKWEEAERMTNKLLKIWFIRNIIRDFAREVDFNKLKPDEGDWYYDTLRNDYDFGGKTLEERIEERKKIDPENWAKYNFEELTNNFLIQYHQFKKAEEVKKDAKNHKSVSFRLPNSNE